MNYQTPTITMVVAAGETVLPFRRLVITTSGTVRHATANEPAELFSTEIGGTAGQSVACRSRFTEGTIAVTGSTSISVAGFCYAASAGRVASTGTILEGECLTASAGDLSVFQMLSLPSGLVNGLVPTIGAGFAGNATLAIAGGTGGVVTATLTTTADLTLLTPASAAPGGGGLAAFAFGAGLITPISSSIVGNVALASSTSTAGEIGLGTTVASGAVAVLGGTAAFENVLEGGVPAALGNQTTANSAVLAVDDVRSYVGSTSGAWSIFCNIASTYAGTGAQLLKSGSVITLNYQPIRTTV